MPNFSRIHKHLAATLRARQGWLLQCFAAYALTR